MEDDALINSGHVNEAFASTLVAAQNAGCLEETRERVRAMVARESFGERFVTKVLGKELGRVCAGMRAALSHVSHGLQPGDLAGCLCGGDVCGDAVFV